MLQFQHKSLINLKHAVFTALVGRGTGEEINTRLMSLSALEITPIIVSSGQTNIQMSQFTYL